MRYKCSSTMVVGEGDNHVFSLAPYITQMNSPKKFDNTLATWDYIYKLHRFLCEEIESSVRMLTTNVKTVGREGP